MALSDKLKMPMFDPKVMTFSQYIEDIYEVKAWGFEWDANKKMRHLALILPKAGVLKCFGTCLLHTKQAMIPSNSNL